MRLLSVAALAALLALPVAPGAAAQGRGARPAEPGAAAPAASQPSAAFPETPPKPGPPRDFKVPEPKRFTLDNGLQVALVQWGTMPKVRVTLSMRTGNVLEKANEVWLADLTGDLI